jgi:hypothetical protein
MSKKNYVCPNCLKETLIRDQYSKRCLPCHIPSLTKGKCRKCGQLLIKENDSDICLNIQRCGTL